ncbi:C-signal-like [Glandiceps talaboti]
MFVRSVLITGANRGIGLELVKQLTASSKPPHHVFATCRNPNAEISKELSEIATKNETVKVIKLDVTNESCIIKAAEDVSHMLGTSCGLNLLINNAGMKAKPRSRFNNMDYENVMDVLTTNTAGPLIVTKHFLPLLKKASSDYEGNAMSCSRSAVINMSSILGSIELTQESRAALYSASKAALNMITKGMSIAFKEDNILTVALHPGWVLTEIGGPRATLSTEESVKGMLDVMATLDNNHSGHFMDYQGKELPW